MQLIFVFLLLVAQAFAAQLNDLEYSRAGGESLRLDAYVPDGSGPHPVVILVHGGGWTGGNRSFVNPLHAPLQRAGYAWFSISYRFAPKHPYPAQIEDVETAIRWVSANAAKYRLDTKRLVLCGESAGGHLVALAAVRADEGAHVAAVVAFYPPVDFTRLDSSDGTELSPMIAGLFGHKRMNEAVRALFRDASPLVRVRAGLPPFLLLHGTADTSIPFDRSTSLLARLREVQVPCELISIDGGDHGMDSWNEETTGYQKGMLTWLGRTLRAERP